MPTLLDEINDKICEISMDTKVGLFIHIACCIERLLEHVPTPKNLQRDAIISQHYKQFKMLLKLVKPIEKVFHIIINDDEIANILTIIYKL